MHEQARLDSLLELVEDVERAVELVQRDWTANGFGIERTENLFVYGRLGARTNEPGSDQLEYHGTKTESGPLGLALHVRQDSVDPNESNNPRSTSNGPST